MSDTEDKENESPSRQKAELVKCIFCSMTLQRNALRRHFLCCTKKEDNEPNRKCSNCGKEQKLIQSFVHEAACKGGEVFECPNCNNFTSKIKVGLHSHIVHCLDVTKEWFKLSLELSKSDKSLEPTKDSNTVQGSHVKKMKKRTKSLGASNDRKCAGCSTTIPSGSVRYHVFNCKPIIEKSPWRECGKCDLSLPIGQSWLHESKCQNNGENDEDTTFKCFKCNNYANKSRGNLQSHLASCIEFLSAFSSKTMFSHTADSKTGSVNHQKRRHTFSGLKKTIAQCSVCSKELDRYRVAQHTFYCSKINELAPKRKCGKCGKTNSIAKSFLHEAKCGHQGGKFKCLNCDDYETPYVSALAIHLAKCLDYLRKHHRTTLSQRHSSADAASEPEPEQNSSPLKIKINSKRRKRKRMTWHHNESGPPKVAKMTTLFQNDQEHDQAVTIKNELIEAPVNVVLAEEIPDQSSSASSESDLVIGDAFSVSDQANMDDNNLACPFCDKSFQSAEDLKAEHPVYCNGMKRFEPEEACQHCGLSLPVSLAGLHSLICPSNPFKLPITKDNLEHCDIHCPECKAVCKAKLLPTHLTTCMKLLPSIMTNATENPKYKWKQPPGSPDYIEIAGLGYWLK